MKPNVVVTSGVTFSDIDTLACGVVLNEILNNSGNPSSLFLPGPQNQSVVPSIRKWAYPTNTAHVDDDSVFIVVDISDPNYLGPILDLSKVIEVYDHHYGFENYWRDKIGDKAHIEPVGACATLIYEKALAVGVKISPVSANLLYTAIISNTLNFNSAVTDDRDRKAFTEISKYIDLPGNWAEIYFHELESESVRDPESSVINDIKIDNIPGFEKPMFIGQLELWNSKDFLLNNQPIIKRSLESKNSPYWFFTSPSISEGKNYLYTENKQIKSLLANTIHADFEGDIGTTPKLILRKEILKKLHTLT